MTRHARLLAAAAGSWLACVAVKEAMAQPAPVNPAPGPAAAKLGQIVEANKTSYVKCMADVEAAYPMNQAPATNYEASVKAVEDGRKAMQAEKKCAVDFRAIVEPKLKAAGASAEGSRDAVSKWFKAHWARMEKEKAEKK